MVDKYKLIAENYTLADVDQIVLLANDAIAKEAAAWFPTVPTGQFQVSRGQVRHILEAIHLYEKGR